MIAYLSGPYKITRDKIPTLDVRNTTNFKWNQNERKTLIDDPLWLICRKTKQKQKDI